MKIKNKDLDKKFWGKEDNLLLFDEFLISSVNNHEEYLLMRRQRIAVDVMMLDNFDMKSAYEMYHCSGLNGLSLKNYCLMIQDFRNSEPDYIVNEVIIELKNKRNKNV